MSMIDTGGEHDGRDSDEAAAEGVDGRADRQIDPAAGRSTPNRESDKNPSPALTRASLWQIKRGRRPETEQLVRGANDSLSHRTPGGHSQNA
jgi:hypothetical protein